MGQLILKNIHKYIAVLMLCEYSIENEGETQ